jgi:hypothetical protein
MARTRHTLARLKRPRTDADRLPIENWPRTQPDPTPLDSPDIESTELDEETPEAGPAPFGTLLGIAPGNVPVYSSDYETADARDLPDRSASSSRAAGCT